MVIVPGGLVEQYCSKYKMSKDPIRFYWADCSLKYVSLMRPHEVHVLVVLSYVGCLNRGSL